MPQHYFKLTPARLHSILVLNEGEGMRQKTADGRYLPRYIEQMLYDAGFDVTAKKFVRGKRYSIMIDGPDKDEAIDYLLKHPDMGFRRRGGILRSSYLVHQFLHELDKGYCD